MNTLEMRHARLVSRATNTGKLFVAQTGTAKGHGVFAARPFARGELVESCVAIIFKVWEDKMHPEDRARMFDWSNLTGEPRQAWALLRGFGSLYNGDNPANMRYEALEIHPRRVHFFANRDIEAGEELTINYSGNKGAAESAGNHWFERRGIPMIPGVHLPVP